MNTNPNKLSQQEVYERAVAAVRAEGRARTSFIQRTLGLDYRGAWELMDRMQSEGIISAPNHVGKREILK
jgi:S-DNA-T family DNA segregation ATPase FtsK/SpoIIIE